MSLFVQACAFFPAIVAVIVVLVAIADRREASALNDLRALGPDAASSDDDDSDAPETCAA